MGRIHRPARPLVGFISPPRWASPSPAEFPAICAAPVMTQQTLLPFHDFDYQLENVARAFPELLIAARSLALAGCQVVAMEGTPFAWAGLESEAATRQRVAQLAQAAGGPALMAATAVVDGLRALGAGRVALAATYYPPDWRDAWGAFVAACGFEVVYCRTMAEEGIVAATDDMDDEGWTTGPDKIRASVARAAETAADAIVVTGAGCRNLGIVAELERIAARPVIGADTALFWAVAKEAGVPLKDRALGALTGL